MRYRQGWKALNRLLHQDRSFSGHEAHCAFLNVGKGSFADVSAATGLNYLDDGRAVAAVDWDFDGDLDLWTSNRTAPRVRFLRNDLNSQHHYLSVLLEGNGTTTNRDAIGARVELHLGGESPRRLIRTLRAGDGFLAQSSKWIHFGLGDRSRIDRFVVRWPGGSSETFQNASANGWFLLRQGTGRCTAWTPPNGRPPLVASAPILPQSSEEARIVLPARLPLPSSSFVDQHGSEISISERFTGPVLVNIWASWCGPCLKELSEWTSRENEIRDTKLDILALSVDLLDEAAGDADALQNVLQQVEFPFASGWATEGLVRNLDLFQRSQLDRWRPAPVPTSFLLDTHGRVAVIYKGPIGVDQLLEDMNLLTAPPGKWRNYAVPFDGRWITEPPNADPLRVCSQFIDHAEIAAGTSYLQQYATGITDSLPDKARGQRLGDIYYVLAVLLREQDHADESLASLRSAATFSPDDVRIRRDLANVLLQRGELDSAAEQLAALLRIVPEEPSANQLLGMIRYQQRQFDAATDHFSKVLLTNPHDIAARLNLANSERANGDFRTAIDEYREVLARQPGNSLATNNLAWILATHADAGIRDGAEAVAVAESLVKSSGSADANAWDTLAAAYAEVGRFTDAVSAVEKAIRLTAESKSPASLQAMQHRLRLYQAGRPYHEPE